MSLKQNSLHRTRGDSGRFIKISSINIMSSIASGNVDTQPNLHARPTNVITASNMIKIHLVSGKSLVASKTIFIRLLNRVSFAGSLMRYSQIRYLKFGQTLKLLFSYSLIALGGRFHGCNGICTFGNQLCATVN